MKNAILFLILSFFLSPKIAYCQDSIKEYEGQIYLQFEERNGYAIGDFTLKNLTKSFDDRQWEICLFKANLENDDWVDEVKKLG